MLPFSLAIYLQDAVAGVRGKEFSTDCTLLSSFLYADRTSIFPKRNSILSDISFIHGRSSPAMPSFEEDEVIIQNPHDSDLIHSQR